VASPQHGHPALRIAVGMRCSGSEIPWRSAPQQLNERYGLNDKRYEKPVREIVKLLTSGTYKVTQVLLLEKRGFILCGKSRYGRQRTLDLATDLLPGREWVTESTDILQCTTAAECLSVLDQHPMHKRYLNRTFTANVAFSVADRSLAEELERENWPVVFLDDA
jgi:hypothetical protein